MVVVAVVVVLLSPSLSVCLGAFLVVLAATEMSFEKGKPRFTTAWQC